MREIARSSEMAIYAESISRDHVHVLISMPPQLSVSRAVQYLQGRGRTSFFRNIERFGSVTGAFTYGLGAIRAASSGNVTDEVWKQYIEDQKPDEPDDHIEVV